MLEKYVVILWLYQTVLSFAKPDSCAPFDPTSCDVEKKVLCSEPPEKGGFCPHFTCHPKTYKGNGNKKCKTQCPLHCGDDYIKCEGPVNKKVCDTFIL